MRCRRSQGDDPVVPSLWPTEKAAERCLRKNTLAAYRDTIRVWGLLTIAVRRSWSSALVRHGADPRAALAEVLGVSAGIFG
jgi:hypothetical protein